MSDIVAAQKEEVVDKKPEEADKKEEVEAPKLTPEDEEKLLMQKIFNQSKELSV